MEGMFQSLAITDLDCGSKYISSYLGSCCEHGLILRLRYTNTLDSLPEEIKITNDSNVVTR
jgi:hypothetical protein